MLTRIYLLYHAHIRVRAHIRVGVLIYNAHVGMIDKNIQAKCENEKYNLLIINKLRFLNVKITVKICKSLF